MYGNKRSAPSAQLNPILKRGIWDNEATKASTVWPERVLPLASVIVPLTIIGISNFLFSRIVSIAKSAALAFKVSKIVSTKRISTPPSIKAFTCSE